MALQFSEAVRNARLNAIETTISTSAVLKIYDLTAGAPANTAAAITAGTLAVMNLPADWAGAASGGSIMLSGTWTDGTADAAGTADFFRLFATDGTTCHIQGTVGQGTGDLQLDNTVIAANQAITVTVFTITDGNA